MVMKTERKIVNGSIIIALIMKLFGIPCEGMRVKSIELTAKANELATIVVKYFCSLPVDSESGEINTEVTKTFTVTENK